MTTIDMSALVQPRTGGSGGLAKGGNGGEEGGDVFDGALRDLAQRGRGRDPGAARQALGERLPEGRAGAPASEGPGDADGEEQRLASLLRERPRSMPIRPGALAFAAPPPKADAEETLAAEEPAQMLLAALGARTQVPREAREGASNAVRTGDASAGPRGAAIDAGAEGAQGDADADPLSAERTPRRLPASSAFASERDLHLSTRIEATPGQALKATVVSQATHLPPALGAQNLQAIVDGALSLLSEPDAPGRGALAFERHLAATGTLAKGAAPVKVLTVQLQPVSLGTVTIALRMTADGVAMEITAADAKAAAMLRQDEARIVDAVRRSGIAGEVVAIHTSSETGAGPRGTGESAAGAQAGAQGGAHAGQGGEAGQGRERKGRSGGETGRGGDENVDTGTRDSGGGNRPDGGVYL